MTDQNKVIPNGRWMHIIPPAILVYIVAFIDRTNIGFAIAGGMDKSLGMTATVTGLVAGIFFIGYLFLQIPGGEESRRGTHCARQGGQGGRGHLCCPIFLRSGTPGTALSSQSPRKSRHSGHQYEIFGKCLSIRRDSGTSRDVQ